MGFGLVSLCLARLRSRLRSRAPFQRIFLGARADPPAPRPRFALVKKKSEEKKSEEKTMHSNCDQQNLGRENHPEAETAPSGVVVWMLNSMP